MTKTQESPAVEPVEPVEAQEDPAFQKIEYAEPDPRIKPLYLFADSQLLFWKEEDGTPFLQRVRAELRVSKPRAIYIGASNGDDPAYYAIFEAAMDEIGITERRMIPSDLESAEDLDWVEHAHLVLLAGGDVERGWNVFKENGLKQILVRRYQEGALMIGISAGAVQLGLAGWGSGGLEGGKLVDTFRIMPCLVGAHEEDQNWLSLKAAVRRFGEHTPGYGIPFGGGLIYHADHSLQPVRKTIVELRVKGRKLIQTMLLPGEGTSTDEEGGEDVVN